jgi:hypothetical protein
VKRLPVLLFVAISTAASATNLGPARIVDLNQPGQLEMLARDNPSEFAKVDAILREAPNLAPEEVPRWLRTAYGAEEGAYGGILLTSEPPKAELSFILGDTKYHARITLSNVRPKPVSGPLKPSK